MIDDAAASQMLSRLRTQGSDDANAEAKACEQGLSKDVWESVSAFANTDGGTLLLGVNEAHDFAVVEGFPVERVIDQFIEGMGDGSATGVRLANPPEYRVNRVFEGGLPFLAVEIDALPSEQKPCHIKSRGMASGSYKRVDDKDIRLSSAEVFELQNALLPSPADREEVEEASIARLDTQAVEMFIENVGRSRSRAFEGAKTTSEKLARMNVLSDGGAVRLAGLLALGIYPQREFPKLSVDVAVHPGNVKGKLAGMRFTDRRECEGSIPEMIDETMDVLARNLKTRSVVHGRTRADELEIPEEVLREAVANALVHREYAARFRGQAVSVDVYPNRIEVANPGGLWGGKTVENIADGVSCCRNPELMKIMRYAASSKGREVFAEGNGSGVPFMLAALHERGLPAPTFIAGFDAFRVVFMRGDVDAWGAVDSGASQRVDAGRAAPSARSPHDDALLAALSAPEPQGIRELASATGISVSALHPRLKRLVDAGAVIATAPPTSKNRRYVLAG